MTLITSLGELWPKPFSATILIKYNVTGERALKVAVLSDPETISWDVCPFQLLSEKYKKLKYWEANGHEMPFNNNYKMIHFSSMNKKLVFEKTFCSKIKLYKAELHIQRFEVLFNIPIYKPIELLYILIYLLVATLLPFKGY